jgi:hypothetical protein
MNLLILFRIFVSLMFNEKQIEKVLFIYLIFLFLFLVNQLMYHFETKSISPTKPNINRWSIWFFLVLVDRLQH